MSSEIRNEARRRERVRGQVEAMRRRFTADIRFVAGTAEGRRLLAWLLGRGGIFSSDCPRDPDEAMFLAGRRSSAVELWNMLRSNLSGDAFAALALADDEEPSAAGSAAAELTEEGGA